MIGVISSDVVILESSGHLTWMWLMFLVCHAAYRTLVPQAGIEPGPMASKVPSPNHWPTSEVR